MDALPASCRAAIAAAAVTPPEDTILDFVSEAGLEMYGVGKIGDIFNQKGLTTDIHTVSNMDGVDKTIEALAKEFDGFLFVNLVDFDSKYGHRRDAIGYGECIEEFDARLPEIMEALAEDDVLMITADHGNADKMFDENGKVNTAHTTNPVPFLVKNATAILKPGRLCDIAPTMLKIMGLDQPAEMTGKSIII